MPGDLRDIRLPLQLMPHVQPGDQLHFSGELMPFTVKTLDRVSGLVTLERNWHGVTYAEWLLERAGVTRG